MNEEATDSTPKKRKIRSVGEWEESFLATLRETGNVRLSCEQANIDRHTAYNRRDRSKEFAAAWQTALDEAVDSLEAEARRRALETSDTLLIFLMKSHRPDVYSDRIRHAGHDGGPLKVQIVEELVDADDPGPVQADRRPDRLPQE